jgi:hypothetical protein
MKAAVLAGVPSSWGRERRCGPEETGGLRILGLVGLDLFSTFFLSLVHLSLLSMDLNPLYLCTVATVS